MTNANINAYVEYRPKSEEQTKGVTHHVVIVNEKEVKQCVTQREAENWACEQGYTVHVARERHLQDRPTPAHWRTADCKASKTGFAKILNKNN
ncbi:hypothetical protein LBW56_23735 [Ralstonia solanacearum]|uniref:hypothetical protein n=1 Tax=Ralstonia solanacearum TaxID=305 RepID=UPI001FF9D3D8|nr:hypothetical protein [Ralstonia solanacearum]MDB0529683.1 hypothetical protein [Ralstonia solanacearum]